jgi:excisionase family DNA binding protein
MELLTIENIAQMCHLHQMTIRRHIKEGKLPAVKVGGRIRVRREDLERFLTPAPVGQRNLVPVVTPPSAEEIQRRRDLFATAMQLRTQIGPIGATTDELVHQGRKEEEASYG